MSDEQKYIIEGLDEYIRQGEPWDISGTSGTGVCLSPLSIMS